MPTVVRVDYECVREPLPWRYIYGTSKSWWRSTRGMFRVFIYQGSLSNMTLFSIILSFATNVIRGNHDKVSSASYVDLQ